MELHKLAISKNYFNFTNAETNEISPFVYDQRVVTKLIEQGATIEEISKSYLEWNTNSKILVYEDRVNTWFLDIAKKLKEDNEAGFVILQIACSQIEGNQQHFEGQVSNRKSKDMFISGLKRFFKELNDAYPPLLTDFYTDVRCGLMHSGITKARVTINASAPNAIKISGPGMKTEVVLHDGTKIVPSIKEEFQKYNKEVCLETKEILVNPHLFLGQVEKGINEYIQKLKDPNEKQLRINFERFFDETG